MLILHFLIQKVQLSVIECKGGGGSSSSSQLLDLVICARSSALDNVKLLQVLYIPAPRSMLHSLVEITCCPRCVCVMRLLQAAAERLGIGLPLLQNELSIGKQVCAPPSSSITLAITTLLLSSLTLPLTALPLLLPPTRLLPHPPPPSPSSPQPSSSLTLVHRQLEFLSCDLSHAGAHRIAFASPPLSHAPQQAKAATSPLLNCLWLLSGTCTLGRQQTALHLAAAAAAVYCKGKRFSLRNRLPCNIQAPNLQA